MTVSLTPLLILLFLLSSKQIFATPWFCKYLKNGCAKGGAANRPVGATYPSGGSIYSKNPSAIPTDKGLGIETLVYNGHYTAHIVTGTGKVGAAISPNSEEDSFFGNAAIENTDDYEQRLRDHRKHRSKKITLATSFGLIGKGKKGKFRLDMGINGRYNAHTKKIHPGAGATMGLSIFHLGYTVFRDDFIDPYSLKSDRFTRHGWFLGLKFPFIAFDYSFIETGGNRPIDIRLLSMTVFIKKWMFTYASRTEYSYRPTYLIEQDRFDYFGSSSSGLTAKYSSFLGIQYQISKKWLVGLYSNYYLLNGRTVSASSFF